MAKRKRYRYFIEDQNGSRLSINGWKVKGQGYMTFSAKWLAVNILNELQTRIKERQLTLGREEI